MTHVYLGDKWTAPALKGLPVTLVKRPDGKVVTGRGKAIMVPAGGRPFVGLLRRTRRIVPIGESTAPA